MEVNYGMTPFSYILLVMLIGFSIATYFLAKHKGFIGKNK